VGYTHRLFFTEALPNQAALCFSSQHLPLYSTSMNSREALVALNMIPHVGPVRYRQLLDSFGDPMSILTASKDKLLRVNSVSEVTAESIATWESGIDLSGELKRIKEFGCQIVVQEDENYPELLRQIYDPPLLLYVKGTLAQKTKIASQSSVPA